MRCTTLHIQNPSTSGLMPSVSTLIFLEGGNSEAIALDEQELVLPTDAEKLVL
uniref:Uncharacterized protein n=1 Tax=Rhizophora mucronata TaxID=61149 RepID=A0A2P2NMX9_RHIMU